MDITKVLLIGGAAFAAYEIFKNMNGASVALPVSVNATANTNVSNTVANVFTGNNINRILLATQSQGPPQGLISTTATGEILAPVWAWSNWTNQVVGGTTPYMQYWSDQNSPVTLNTFIAVVQSGTSGLAGLGFVGRAMGSRGKGAYGALELLNAAR